MGFGFFFLFKKKCFQLLVFVVFVGAEWLLRDEMTGREVVRNREGSIKLG